MICTILVCGSDKEKCECRTDFDNGELFWFEDYFLKEKIST